MSWIWRATCLASARLAAIVGDAAACVSETVRSSVVRRRSAAETRVRRAQPTARTWPQAANIASEATRRSSRQAPTTPNVYESPYGVPGPQDGRTTRPDGRTPHMKAARIALMLALPIVLVASACGGGSSGGGGSTPAGSGGGGQVVSIPVADR